VRRGFSWDGVRECATSLGGAGDPLLGQADRLLMMPDLFHHFLVGTAVAEYTIASTSQCLDPVARDWARPLLERFGIPAMKLNGFFSAAHTVRNSRDVPRRRNRIASA
jgi:hypothetical protein